MKNRYKIMLLLCAFISLNSCKEESKSEDLASNEFSLEGEISGIADGYQVKLYPLTHSAAPALDSTKIKDGKFSFKGSMEEPRLYYVIVDSLAGSFPIILENKAITLKADAEIGEAQPDYTPVTYKNIKIEGSEANTYFMERTAYRDTLNERYEALNKKHENILNKSSEAYETGGNEAYAKISETEAYKAFEADNTVFMDEVQTRFENLVLTDKDSWWGPMFMMHSLSYLGKEQQPIFDQFSDEAKNSYYGKLAAEEIYPKSLLNTTVPDFSIENKDGKEFAIYELAQGKKYTLIDFWASWCAPCRKEIPNLKEAYAKYADQGFEIVSISIDQKRDAWVKALNEENMPWPNLYDTKKVSEDFLVKAIPATFLIDERGTIINDTLRGPALEQKLEELFSK